MAMSLTQRAFFFALLAVAVLHVLAATVQRRSADEEEVIICQGRTPCSWALYNKTTRYIYDIQKNRCICDGEKRCLRDYDDISISSYVYRCKVEEPKPTESAA